MAQDRRRFQRVALDSPLAVLLGEFANGFVCDLCEEGLGASELALRMPGEVIPFAFELPEGSGRIRGQAEIVWKSESGRRTGLRFVELADSCRERLVQWISSRAWTMRLDGMEKNYPEPPDALAVAARIPADVAPANDATKVNDGWGLPPMSPTLGAELESNEPDLVAGASTPSAVSTRTVGIALAVVLLVAGLGFLVSSSHRTRATALVQASVNATAAPLAAASALPPTAGAPSPAALPATPALPPIKPAPTKTAESPAPRSAPKEAGFVLQVAAMTHEGNADALTTELHHKRVPAFVFRREGDAFYRVAVGPFRGSESPAAIQDTLEKQGLKPFRRPWNPGKE